MGNLTNLPTITDEAIMNEAASANQIQKKQTSGFDTKNYLNVRLNEDAGETEKVITIRLLPIDLKTGNPFVKVHYHNVKVPSEVSKSGYKSYMCLSKNPDIDHDKYGTKCPFCELNSSAYQESLKETDPVKKKMLQEVSIANHSRESVIARCIERGHEDEGVKFWKFNIRLDKTDPYNQIINLYKQRKAEGEQAGQPCNILDIYNGYDLSIKITAGNAAPTVTDAKYSTPLSKDAEQMRAWIYDEKKWQDVFTPKPYEYLSLVSQQKVPFYDKENNIWIDKEEYENIVNGKKSVAMSNVKSAEDAITGGTVNREPDIISSMTITDNGLPF